MPHADLTAGLFKLRFQALGTKCVVQFRAPSVEAAREYRSAALAWIREFEETWSRFRPNSLLCQINAAAGDHPVELTPAQDKIIELCQYTYQFTKGLLDPTSLPLTQLWDRAAKNNTIPSEQKIKETLTHVGWPKVEHQSGQIFLPHQGMALEIGGFGKEYAVDQLIHLAREYGIDSALVDLGRDLATLGSPPHGKYWIAGAENARELDAPLHRLALSGQALATSGNGRRFRMIAGEKFGHIINPHTGRPVLNDMLSATCLADRCLTAGLLSTSACILGSTDGLAEINRHLKVEALLQTAKETLYSQKIHLHLI